MPWEVGLEAAADVTALAEKFGPEGFSPAQGALAWVWQRASASTVIPVARNPEQARANAASSELPWFSEELLIGIREVYDNRVRELVHDRW